MNKRTTENFQPEPQPNSEQKADDKQVSHAIGNTNVVGIPFVQREIKFRAWDNIKNEMKEDLKFSPVFRVSLNKDIFNNDVLMLRYMQFIGSKDKNGKEVYEGDIARYYSRVGFVVYDEKRAAYCLYTPSDEVFVQLQNTIVSDIVLIGNVFENPELLQTVQ